MISSNSFTKDWIQSKSIHFGRIKKKADPVLIEKVIIALHLLEHLAQSKLEFIFKGGTSLLLLLEEMHRFSIDIDIIVEGNKKEINIGSILSKIVNKNNIFTNFEEHIRKSSNVIPKSHYKIYYKSSLDDSINYILESAIISASKAAYLSLLLKYGINKVEKYHPKIDLSTLKIAIPGYNHYKTIMKIDSEAYLYWYKSIEIINKNKH